MESLNDFLVSISGEIDDFMYTYILVILLVFAGIYFTIRTKFVQIRYIKDMFTALAGKSAAADKEFGDFDKDVVKHADEEISEQTQEDNAAYAGDPSKKKKISSFQALMVSTASRVGTGNIVGIATAIAMGGPGAVFWMWLMAVVGAASAFV